MSLWMLILLVSNFKFSVRKYYSCCEGYMHTMCFTSYRNTLVSSVITGIRSWNFWDKWRTQRCVNVSLSDVHWIRKSIKLPICSKNNINSQLAHQVCCGWLLFLKKNGKYLFNSYLKWKSRNFHNRCKFCCYTQPLTGNKISVFKNSNFDL